MKMIEMTFAAAAALMLAGCENSGGRVIGPSGVLAPGTALDGGYKIVKTMTCEIPCKTVDDCEKFKPQEEDGGRLYEIPYAWKSCTNGVCIDVECMTDEDCAKHPYYSTYDGGVVVTENRRGVTCVHNQCAPYPDPGTGTCRDSRDKAVDGRCIRQPEIPDPACKGSMCECFSDSDCHPWSDCRAENACRPYQSNGYTNATGRECDSNVACGKYYLHQDMLAAGASNEIQSEANLCTDICVPPEEFIGNHCGGGFACVKVTDIDKVDPNGVFGSRSVCVPDECTASGGCPSTYKECIDDKGCPSGDECTWPWGGCFGVCVPVKCKACADWMTAHRTRACHTTETKVWLDGGTAGEVEVPINVRRPD